MFVCDWSDSTCGENAMWNPFSKTWKERCSDGTTRIVYKNPDDAFPLSLSNTTTDFSASAKALEAVNLGEGKVSAKIP